MSLRQDIIYSLWPVESALDKSMSNLMCWQSTHARRALARERLMINLVNLSRIGGPSVRMEGLSEPHLQNILADKVGSL